MLRRPLLKEILRPHIKTHSHGLGPPALHPGLDKIPRRQDPPEAPNGVRFELPSGSLHFKEPFINPLREPQWAPFIEQTRIGV